MTIRRPLILILPACLLLSTATTSGGDLGRLFTTPEQRAQLDDLRYRKEIVVDISEFEVEPEDEPESVMPEMQDSITVKGVVFRHGGSNTAWINDINTLTGGIETQQLNITPADIDRGYIYIMLPGMDQKLRLRVGERFEPATGKTEDVIPSE